MDKLKTKIGLEIHVQLKTKSKMFCGCDNNAQDKEPNTVVCPVCLGLPGSLPVANKQAVLWTLKSGLALNCKINQISKFDRKHYFYPDLPKGYQISQYDEPLCGEGYIQINDARIRINRIHLEEDAGKLTHSHGKSLVDLNRAGTPLMEIVTEPDITSPKQAGEFLRKLQKIVRDVLAVSEASMEKGHLRCDANISVNDGKEMSEIVELKNINSFRFVEKALTIEDEKLRLKYPDWPTKLTKETHGYNSDNNTTYIQRRKEEAADYRYFPEPDLPPIDIKEFDLEALRAEFNESEEEKISELVSLGLLEADAKVLAANKLKADLFAEISVNLDKADVALVARTIVQNYYGFELTKEDVEKAAEYAKAIEALKGNKVSKQNFGQLAAGIHQGEIDLDTFLAKLESSKAGVSLESIIQKVLDENGAEVGRYKAGEKQLLGFLMGQAMKAANGSANPQEISQLLRERLEA